MTRNRDLFRFAQTWTVLLMKIAGGIRGYTKNYLAPVLKGGIKLTLFFGEKLLFTDSSVLVFLKCGHPPESYL